jgi:L-galactono-1,4-lactone dehydrogenase
MQELLQLIEEEEVPAPAPIEQRWTASSTADMSPAAARGAPDALHSWVGIIMYLPTQDPAERQAITERCPLHC